MNILFIQSIQFYINPFNASVAPYRNQPTDLLCNSNRSDKMINLRFIACQFSLYQILNIIIATSWQL